MFQKLYLSYVSYSPNGLTGYIISQTRKTRQFDHPSCWQNSRNVIFKPVVQDARNRFFFRWRHSAESLPNTQKRDSLTIPPAGKTRKMSFSGQLYKGCAKVSVDQDVFPIVSSDLSRALPTTARENHWTQFVNDNRVEYSIETRSDFENGAKNSSRIK